MDKNTNSNIKLNFIYGSAILKNNTNNEIMDISIKNILNKYKEIELESKTYISSNKKFNKILQTIIKLGDRIISSNNSKLELILSNKLNLGFSNSKNLNNELTKIILNNSNLIFVNEQQYIGLISPFNSKLANLTNYMYTFTNRRYKQIN